MKKLTILLFSILISLNSNADWEETDKTMWEILSVQPMADIISTVTKDTIIIYTMKSPTNVIPPQYYRCNSYYSPPSNYTTECWKLKK